MIVKNNVIKVDLGYSANLLADKGKLYDRIDIKTWQDKYQDMLELEKEEEFLMVVIIIILSIIIIAGGVYIIRLKRDIASLKRMLQTIKNSDTNMQLTTTTFDKNICQLAIEVNQVIEKQQKLMIETERSNREFRQGISNVSHDLRTPLTSAAGYIQMIIAGKVDEDKKQEYLHIVENRLHSLTTLMKELFEYTQIIEGQLTVNIEKVNICNLLRDKLSVFYEEFTKKGFEIKIDIPDTPIYVMGDGHLLQRACQNVIQNALNHGQKSFELKVSDEKPENKAVITFANEVSEEDIQVERLFERFYTSDASRTSRNTGLGLSIVKELVEHMGGSIVAEQKKEVLIFKIELTSFMK